MPIIDFRALRELVAEFDELTTAGAHRSAHPRLHGRLEDVQYTICVYTGLRDPRAAMSRARNLLRDHGAGESGGTGTP